MLMLIAANVFVLTAAVC